MTVVWVTLATAQSPVVKVVLHNFATPPKGATPIAGVIGDADGNLYGTTYFGGAYSYGTVFQIDPSGRVTVLHSFTEAEGGNTFVGVVRDDAGNLYGTTSGGGAYGHGTVYRIDPSGREMVLHSFALEDPAGYAPEAGVIRDDLGNLYGTTSGGGASEFGNGAVYKIDSSGQSTVVYSFAEMDGFPLTGVIRDDAGNLYGATDDGDDSAGTGKVYRIDAFGQATILHTLSSREGSDPLGELIRDGAGNLYGTTNYGGGFGQGTVYKIDSSGHATVLHSFQGPDGVAPVGGVVRDSAGNLFGTTSVGACPVAAQCTRSIHWDKRLWCTASRVSMELTLKRG